MEAGVNAYTLESGIGDDKISWSGFGGFGSNNSISMSERLLYLPANVTKKMNDIEFNTF